ncbi:hypothetical protein GF359_09085, partial [candidate division WOR-3 bacterium]|nr:hypothetical protein [candidate division WOR-3 bacterium]MBD3365352.1 hypothetical protein [candidate division WOR-3 bacterium]
MNEQKITPPEIVEGLKELGFEVVERTSLETKLEKGEYQVTIPMKKIDPKQAEEITQA